MGISWLVQRSRDGATVYVKSWSHIYTRASCFCVCVVCCAMHVCNAMGRLHCSHRCAHRDAYVTTCVTQASYILWHFRAYVVDVDSDSCLHSRACICVRVVLSLSFAARIPQRHCRILLLHNWVRIIYFWRTTSYDTFVSLSIASVAIDVCLRRRRERNKNYNSVTHVNGSSKLKQAWTGSAMIACLCFVDNIWCGCGDYCIKLIGYFTSIWFIEL